MRTYNLSDATASVVPALGQSMPLDRSTPRGLFETRSGTRYFVSFDDEYGPLAVILRHHSRAPFTWRQLGGRLAMGRWWGPCRVTLGRRYEPDRGPLTPGSIFIMETILGIDCEPGTSGGRAIALGSVSAAQADMCDVECWSIYAARASFLFCRRSQGGRLRYGPAPLERVADWTSDDFIELGDGRRTR